MTKEKTWSQLEEQISETFRKWGKMPPTITYNIAKRSVAKRSQSREERAVSISFYHHSKRILIEMVREDRAIDNLAKIATAVEEIRLAEVRGTKDLIVLLYRQMYPAPSAQQQAPPPPPPRTTPPSGPYAVLHVAQDAPLEVCEAAYRALTKKAHPDMGGDTATMQRLNAAIEQIRKEHTK
jgi:hypothetical protein